MVLDVIKVIILLFFVCAFCYLNKGEKIDFVIPDKCHILVKELQRQLADNALAAVRKVSKQCILTPLEHLYKFTCQRAKMLPFTS